MRFKAHVKGDGTLRIEDPDRLRSWLKLHEMSYAELGSMVGVSKQFIGQLATGKVNTCRPETAAKIELVLLPPEEHRYPGFKTIFTERTSLNGAKGPRSRPSKARRGARRMPLEERFMRHVDKRGEDECWPWTGAKLSSGYGLFRVDDRRHVAHRVSYALFVGAIPRGMQIDHVHARGCRQRDCVNPKHLEPVTASENIKRSVRARGIDGLSCRQGHLYADVGVYPWGREGSGIRCAECERERQRKRYAEAKESSVLSLVSKTTGDSSGTVVGLANTPN